MRKIYTKGFSLVELSISIIIIGLLIAGITSGTKLIQQAEMRSAISEMNNFASYYNTFVSTYDAVPGDFANADTYWTGTTCHATVSAACNGDGDGLIRWRDVAVTAAATGDESGRAVKHLSLAGIIPYSVGQLTITYAGGMNLLSTATQLIPPQSKSNSANAYFFAYNTTGTATTTDAIGENAGGTAFIASPWAGQAVNAIFLGGMIQTANKSPVAGALTPTTAFSIDRKIDDGAYSGTSAAGASTGIFRTINSVSGTCLSGANYDLTVTATYCMSGLKIS